MKKITAIVPVLNEADRIADVLKVLTTSAYIRKVIVVDGHSTDKTPDIVKKFPVKLIIKKYNQGKGKDVKDVLKYVTTEIVLLCDGDLIGLSQKHIAQLVQPVLRKKNTMTIAMLDKYWHLGSDFVKENFMLLPINGTRALLTKHLRQACKHKLFAEYGMEPVINFYCRKNGIKTKLVNLHGVKDVIKMQKRKHGWKPHIRETVNVASVYAHLYMEDAYQHGKILQQIPKKLVNRLK